MSEKTAPSQANLYRFHAPLSEQYAREVEEQAFFNLSAKRPYTHTELLSCLRLHDESTTSFTKEQVFAAMVALFRQNDTGPQSHDQSALDKQTASLYTYFSKPGGMYQEEIPV